MAVKARLTEEAAQSRLRVTANLIRLRQQLASGASQAEMEAKFDRLIEELTPGMLTEDGRAEEGDAEQQDKFA